MNRRPWTDQLNMRREIARHWLGQHECDVDPLAIERFGKTMARSTKPSSNKRRKLPAEHEYAWCHLIPKASPRGVRFVLHFERDARRSVLL